MTISPVTFVASAPIKAIERVERVKRRAKSQVTREVEGAEADFASEPMFAAVSPEELATDSTRDALLNIRLGG
jgi:hypothetical protein